MRRVGWSSMEALLSGLSVAVALVLTTVLLGRLHPLLLLLPLAAVPPVLLGRRAEAILGAGRDRAAESNRRSRHLFDLSVSAGPAKELRIFGLTAELTRRQGIEWQAGTVSLWRAERRAAALRIIGQGIFAIAYIGATLVVIQDVVSGRGSAGQVVLVLTLAALVNEQVTTAITLLQELQRVAHTLDNFRWMRDLVRPAPTALATAPAPDRIRDHIALRDVSFAYPGRDEPVLSHVDLTLPAGSTVAVVGENGAGKTTLVKLLCRFYEPTGGRIEVDDVDLASVPVEEWRQRIAAGFQDFVRYEMAAREVVGVGDLTRIDSDDAVIDALHRARSENVVDRLEHGLDTQLGVSYGPGTQLSGGQWQKLAMGRAMMREWPLLLVLDEPTAALDAESEHLLFEQYAENARRVGARTGAVTLLVSHRFSTVQMADLIVVVATGGIAEVGSHEDLVAAGGLYAELYGLQAQAYG
jgi:ATP-binding cassette subfamily B protein